jgi:hypothetical protein
MYQFSRGIYRELAPYIAKPRPGCAQLSNHEDVLRACEAAVQRLANDRHYFARPARTLFSDIRLYFPMSAQERVYQVVARYLGYAQQFLAEHPFASFDATGEPLQCRATTRKGTACQRIPLPHNGYCPSHQHLADTEDTEDTEELVAA